MTQPVTLAITQDGKMPFGWRSGRLIQPRLTHGRLTRARGSNNPATIQKLQAEIDRAKVIHRFMNGANKIIRASRE